LERKEHCGGEEKSEATGRERACGDVDAAIGTEEVAAVVDDGIVGDAIAFFATQQVDKLAVSALLSHLNGRRLYSTFALELLHFHRSFLTLRRKS
jgi:hypothetical protein